MVDDTFKPDDKRPGDASEGVRIIGAEEAAEALERGDVASRRGGDAPRYGDRPKKQPVGPRPALRFPLEPSADPTNIEKPPVRPTGGIEFEPLTTIGEAGGGRRFDPLPDGEVPAVAEVVDEPSPPDDVAPISIGQPAPPEVLPGDDAEPPAPIEMPHWSDPPTGEVPKVIAGEESDDLDAWSSFAASSPRWRDTDRDWESDASVHEMLGADAEWRVGAMDDSRPTDDEIYSFEDLAPEAPVPAEVAASLDAPLELDADWVTEPAEPGPIAIGARGGRRTPPERRNPVADYASGGSGYAPPTGNSGRNIQTAIIVGVVLVAVVALAMKAGSNVAIGLVTIVIGLCAIEFFNAVRRAGYQPAVLFGIVACVACPLAVYWKGYAAYPILAAVIVIAAFLWHFAEADPDARVVESMGVTLLGVGWIGGLGSFAGLMLALPDGRGMLWAVIIATVGYDAGGLFVGRNAGSRPLSDASPNKTQEGLIGGVIVAIVLTVILVGLIGIAPFDKVSTALLIGIAAAVAAPLGDLCQSLLKRDLGIKDMGSLLPEHGGMLDRVDGLLFVLPVVFYVAVALHLGPFA